MRVILLECKKILDIRLLLIWLLFTVVFYNEFMEIMRYPSSGMASSEYDIPFEMELVREWGPVLKTTEMNKIAEKEAKLQKEVDPYVASDPVMKKVGIHTFAELKKRQNELFGKESRNELEEEIIQTYDDIFFETNEHITRICFELQVLSRFTEAAGWSWNMDEKRANWVLDQRNDHTYREEKVARMTDGFTSLNSDGAMYMLREDLHRLLIVIFIGNFLLILPYQVGERICGVLPLYAVCNGRKIFGKQLIASVLSCGLCGAVQVLGYLALYQRKGLGTFWICPAWTTYDNFYWKVPDFGWYTGIYLLLVWLVTTASVVVVYLLGRIAMNYIAGIAISIPVGIVLSFSFIALFVNLFSYQENPLPPYWEVWAACGFVLVCVVLAIVRLWQDGRRDIQ